MPSYNGFSPQSKKIIDHLEQLGWTFTVSGKGHALGKAPDGVTTCAIGRKLSRADRSQQNAEAVVRSWIRSQAPEDVARIETVASAMVASDPDPVLDAVMDRAVDKHVSKAVSISLDRSDSELTLVSAKPWLSRMGTNRTKLTASLVENDRVLERTWSDGTVDWVCSLCGYRADAPRSVAAHYGQTHTKSGEAEKRDASARVPVATGVHVDPATIRNGYTGHGYTPTDRLVAALMAFLSEQGDIGGLEETAVAALRWFHERPDLEPAEEREPHTMTDAEIIARVRLLVGGRDVALEAEHAALLERYDAALAEVTRLSDVLSTLGQIASDEVSKH